MNDQQVKVAIDPATNFPQREDGLFEWVSSQGNFRAFVIGDAAQLEKIQTPGPRFDIIPGVSNRHQIFEIIRKPSVRNIYFKHKT